MIPRPRIVVFVALALALVVVLIVARLAWMRGPGGDDARVAGDSTASLVPSLEPASGWLNGGPITADSLSGRPAVLVLWSDTDPRCVASLPEVQSWFQAYTRFGLRVVGVYAPDYSFGADPAVAAHAARRLGLGFPIALDPEYRIAFGGGTARPALMVADTSGHIVLRAEGDRLAAVDQAIRDLIRGLHPDIVFPADAGESSEAAAGAANVTRFAFLGTARAAAGPIAGSAPGRTLAFTAQFRFQEEGETHVPFPVGRWTTSAEGLTAEHGGAMNYVAIRYSGERVSLVMRPPANGRTRVWILEDEAWMPEPSRGEDVRADRRGATYVDVSEPRLYWIARGAKSHVLKLSPEDAGVTYYAFAFQPLGRPGPSAGSGAATPDAREKSR